MSKDALWWKTAVFYQIYPRSFQDSTGNGIGDLPGITDRLGYLADLGIDAIWISPFFKSPMADYGYDVSDYRCVDPLFGTNEDFDILLKRAHELGLKIIIDMVLSHTSIEHPWFVESRLSNNNRKADWYVWADPKPDGSPPNNWQSVFDGPAWSFDTRRGQYYLHNFLKEQPDLNFHNLDVQKQMLSECEYWLERGVDGFRLDTANFYTHDAQLRDNPPRVIGETITNGTQFEKLHPYSMQRHLYDKSQPENLEFLKKLKSLMNKYPGTMTLGEIGDDDPYKLGVEYTDNGQYLDTAYNTHFMSGTDSRNLKKDLIETPITLLQDISLNAWPSWAFANHDVVRPLTRWGKGVKDQKAFSKMLIQILLTLRGTPFLYQGEELGLPEAIIPFEDIQDPWGKALWPEWQGRDGCRTPMPWEHLSDNAGFSRNNAGTWLPIPEEHKQRAADLQVNVDNSVYEFTKSFLSWRKTKPVLQLGNMDFIESNHDSILSYRRFDQNSEIICTFNIAEIDVIYEGKKLNAFEAAFTEN
ncbi:MAG: alpha-glucosidase [Alphaproteobacteria bacterium]|nr:alpha-glucosidase [Alphaproteobacteria bacterium]NCQ89045.1 alpha-glucosidase [Alphaproteobacteria bacterium]NCT07945.1 alpha-glucosidase [Alphaproteobacteria bacterium]